MAAAWYVAGTGPRELVDVWLRLESSGFVQVTVAADWTLRITESDPYSPYEMPELESRIEVEIVVAGIPMTQHLNERLLEITESFDPDVDERKEAEFHFETGSVIACAFGGDLHLRPG